VSTVSPRRWVECSVSDTGTNARFGELHGMHCRCTRAVPTAAWEVWVGVCRGLPPHQLRRSGACAPAVPRRAVRRAVLREMSAVCQDARSPSVEVLCTNEGTVSTVCGSGRSLGCVDRAKPRVRPRRTSAVGCGPEASLNMRLGSSMAYPRGASVERRCATRLGARCSVPCWMAALHDTCPHRAPRVATFAAGRAAGACACHPPLLWLVRTHGGDRLRSCSRRLLSGAGFTPTVSDSRLVSTSCEGGAIARSPPTVESHLHSPHIVVLERAQTLEPNHLWTSPRGPGG